MGQTCRKETLKCLISFDLDLCSTNGYQCSDYQMKTLGKCWWRNIIMVDNLDPEDLTATQKVWTDGT